MPRPTTSRPKLNPPKGRMAVLQYCSPLELAVDESYQRGLEDARSRDLIRHIAQQWDWGLCQPLVVSRRAGGALFVIDGQHRLEAARQRGDIVQLPCVVLDFTSAADEAASFVHLNQQRKPLNKLDLFRAAIASANPQAVAIAEALADAGLSLASHTNYTAWKPGMVANIGGIERAWTREGPVVTTRALTALAEAFRGQVLQYAGTLFRGVVRVCRDEQREHGGFAGARFERFVAMLGRQPQREWIRDIKRWFAETDALFQGEAVDGLFRHEWGRVWQRGGAKVALPPPANREAAGEAEWSWCTQCDARRTKDQVAACHSKFCKLKVAA